MRAFLGCLIYVGLCTLGDMKNYWSNELGQDRISSVFPQYKFIDLWRHLHCNDNTKILPKDNVNHDRLHEIRSVMNMLQHSFKEGWEPHQQNSIDEGIIPFNGRSSIKQYMKGKPTKWGFKMWKLVGARSAYLYALDIYSRKEEDREVGLHEHIVLQMADQL